MKVHTGSHRWGFLFSLSSRSLKGKKQYCEMIRHTFSPSSHLQVNYSLQDREKSFVCTGFMPEVLEGKERKYGKEGFHGAARRRVSVVKPNIRDSIPNTEPSVRVCHPREIENICHPLQAPACFYKSGTHNPLRSFLHFNSHVAQLRKKKHSEQKKRWWAVLEVNV